MKKSICIKTNNNKTLNYLLNYFKDISNTSVSLNHFKIYDNIIIHYLDDNLNTFHNTITDAILNVIITFYEKNLFKRILNTHYFYFLDIEKSEILNLCTELISSNEISHDKIPIYLRKQILLFESIYEYIQNNKNIVLDGVINFRLKKYIDLLDEIVDLSVNNFILKREYLEFIKLLKLYVDSKDCLVNTVHLIYTDGNSKLLDEDKNLIDLDNDAFNLKYLSDISFSSNDYALNTLLTLLPNKIMLHLSNYIKDDFINSLEMIFENKLIICTNCELCQKNELINIK